tara:strand:+ start:139 stop:396 length:258 start_codon:yes stop_codon:yes gene_type:complete
MSRYKNTKRENRKFKTSLYDSVPMKNDDIYLITQEGDRLDTLAYEYYRDPNLWWFIGRANNISTMNLPAGTSLRVPISPSSAKVK